MGLGYVEFLECTLLLCTWAQSPCIGGTFRPRYSLFRYMDRVGAYMDLGVTRLTLLPVLEGLGVLTQTSFLKKAP